MISTVSNLVTSREDQRPVKLFDLSIEDLKERQQKAIVYSKPFLAARAIYTHTDDIVQAAARRGRTTSKTLGKKFAVRFVKEEAK